MARFPELIFKDSAGSERDWRCIEPSNGPATDSRLMESVVQHDARERSIDLKTSVVFDETEFAKLVHEKLTGERIEPILCARVSWHTLGAPRAACPRFRSWRAVAEYGRAASRPLIVSHSVLGREARPPPLAG